MPFSFTVSFFTRVSVLLKSLGVQKAHILRYGERSPTCPEGDLEIAYLKGTETSYTGKAVSWYENGQKEIETNFKDGKTDLWTVWYENGQKKLEANFKDGKLDGLSVSWHKNGQKEGKKTYKDGKMVSKKLWNRKGELVDSWEEAKAE